MLPFSGNFYDKDGKIRNIAELFELTGGGGTGSSGWSPVLSLVQDNERIVMKIADWTGGTGTKPEAGMYVGESGYVSDIALAINVKGDSSIESRVINLEGIHYSNEPPQDKTELWAKPIES